MKNACVKISWNFFWNFFKFPKFFLKFLEFFKINFLIQKFPWNFFSVFRNFWKIFPDIFISTVDQDLLHIPFKPMKSPAFRYPGKQEFSPLILFRSRQGQNRGFPNFCIPQPIIEKISLPISAICFLNFTSEKLGKRVNYARVFGTSNAESMRLKKTAVCAYYARNPGQDLPSGVDRWSLHRRRLRSWKGAQLWCSLQLLTWIVWLLPQPHQNLRRCPSVRNPYFKLKTGVLFVFRYPGMSLPRIACPKASISEHFRGHFQPKSGKRTAIIAYSYNHVPEFAIFCNQIRKIIPLWHRVESVLRRRLRSWKGAELWGSLQFLTRAMAFPDAKCHPIH
jgi:hypothetical protein